MKITIHCIGKERALAINNLIDEYLKRTRWQIEFKEYNCNKELSIDELKIFEGRLLLQKVSSSSFKIVLDELGEQLNSKQFANLISKNFDQGINHIEFFIGGAFGHGDEIKNKCNYMMSLSNLTYPHKLVRLIIAEQLYRAYTLINNHPYHK